MICIFRLSSFEDLEDAVTDVPVINVLALIGLQPPDEEGRQREQDDLVERLQDELEQQLAQQIRAGKHAQEGDGEEQQGVGGLSGDGAQGETSGELFPARPDLHLAEHRGVDETARQEGDAGGEGDAREI